MEVYWVGITIGRVISAELDNIMIHDGQFIKSTYLFHYDNMILEWIVILGGQ